MQDNLGSPPLAADRGSLPKSPTLCYTENKGDNKTVSGSEAYYEVVRKTLERNIRDRVLPDGTRLYVAALADRLGISRSPVKRALEMLEQSGMVRRTDGQGWVVGTQQENGARTNLHLLQLALPQSGSTLPVKPGWERITQTLATEVTRCIPFGSWRISESELCTRFAVSRTVIREVLARLHERGLIGKNRSSHWTAGPLSAQMLNETHDLRRLVEPLALRRAAHSLDNRKLAAMRDRVEAALAAPDTPTPEQMDVIENDLHFECVASQTSNQIRNALERLRISMIVNQQFTRHVARHQESTALTEHRLVLDHLIAGDPEGAAAALTFHLDADHLRTRDRLKVLSIFSVEDDDVPPYLTRVL